MCCLICWKQLCKAHTIANQAFDLCYTKSAQTTKPTNMSKLDDLNLTMEEAIEWLEEAVDRSTAENPRLSPQDQAWERLRLAVDVDEAFKHASRLGEVPKSLAQSKKTTKALELVKQYPEQSSALAKAVLGTQSLHVQVERLKEARRPRRVTKYQAQGLEAQVATLSDQVKELTQAINKLNARLDAK